MKIKEIISQHRRDFIAIYECEYCGDTHEGSGYDDSYFHNSVISEIECPKYKKKAPENYRPLTTKYPDDQTV